MISSLDNIKQIPELKKKIWFTLFMLAVYRLGVFVSTPGINVEALRNMFQDAGEHCLVFLICSLVDR